MVWQAHLPCVPSFLNCMWPVLSEKDQGARRRPFLFTCGQKHQPSIGMRKAWCTSTTFQPWLPGTLGGGRRMGGSGGRGTGRGTALGRHPTYSLHCLDRGPKQAHRQAAAYTKTTAAGCHHCLPFRQAGGAACRPLFIGCACLPQACTWAPTLLFGLYPHMPGSLMPHMPSPCKTGRHGSCRTCTLRTMHSILEA